MLSNYSANRQQPSFENGERSVYMSYLVTETTSLSREDADDEYVLECCDTMNTAYELSMKVDQTDDNLERSKWRRFLLGAKRWSILLFWFGFFAGYYVYLGFCLYLNPRDSGFVCLIGLGFGVYLFDRLTRRRARQVVLRAWTSIRRRLKTQTKHSLWIRRITTVVFLLAIATFVIYDIRDDWLRYIPLGGLLFFIVLSVAFSVHPRKIRWYPVLWGLILQFCLGLLILRWEPGFLACRWLGDQVTVFLGYTDAGSKFVFGDKYLDHPVAFQILPVVVFFAAIVHVLNYLGVMQIIIRAIASVLQFTMTTTPIESFATSAHIFIGLVECSVTLRPFWVVLTLSEIHAVMTGGCATIAGTVIAAYISFGVPADHLITASFMSAPAALAIAKISFPETGESKIKSQKEIHIPSGSEVNFIEALSAGASSAIKLVAYVVVNLIAFLAVLAFLDASLSYLGSRVNFPDLSFHLVSSYVFTPIAAMIGIPWHECEVVAALIGKKILINEFLAFIELGNLIKAGDISTFSGTVATYCLCGFGSIVAIGINLASLTSAEPSRRSDFARLSVRSIVNGNIACMMTACVASLLYKDAGGSDILTTLANSTASNLTDMVVNATDLTTTISTITL